MDSRQITARQRAVDRQLVHEGTSRPKSATRPSLIWPQMLQLHTNLPIRFTSRAVLNVRLRDNGRLRFPYRQRKDRTRVVVDHNRVVRFQVLAETAVVFEPPTGELRKKQE